MEKHVKDSILETIEQFHLPKYEEVPDVGLYLDQTVKYVNAFFIKIPNVELTSSMVSNYVKKGLIERPIKKAYTRDQICYLIFITLAKTVLTMENIQILFAAQKRVYETKVAYEYLRLELDNVLNYVFGLKDTIDNIGVTVSDEKELLRNTIMVISHKIYLELCFDLIRQKEEQ